jgi:hypothetical protein
VTKAKGFIELQKQTVRFSITSVLFNDDLQLGLQFYRVQDPPL